MRLCLILQGIIPWLQLASTVLGDMVTIEKITITSPVGQGLELCWRENSPSYVKAELTVLLNSGAITQTPISGTLSNHCAMFENDPALTVQVGDPIAFILRLYLAANTRPAPDSQGFVTIDSWPDVTACQSIDIALASNDVIRFQCDEEITFDHKLTLEDGTQITCSLSSDGKSITYCFLDNFVSPSASLATCKDLAATINEVPSSLGICTSPLIINPFNGIDTKATYLELDYINLQTSSRVTPEANSKNFDVINYWEVTPGTNVYSAVCSSSKMGPHKCPATKYNPGRKDMKILLVGYDSGDTPTVKQSSANTILDIALDGDFILDKTMELRWENPLAKDGVFRAVISNWVGGTGKPTFTEANIICPLINTICYAYFLDIPAGTTSCDISVDIIEAEGEEPKGLNVIKRTIPKLSFRRSQRALAIQDVQVAWLPKHNKVHTRVCFNHTSQNVERVFSHYEFVMINNKGQWLRHKLVTQEIEGELCFPPFFINTKKFDVSQEAAIIITQRAEDGVTVLAGGDTRIVFVEFHENI